MLIPKLTVLPRGNQFWLSDLDKKHEMATKTTLNKQVEYQTGSTSETMSTDSNNRTM